MESVMGSHWTERLHSQKDYCFRRWKTQLPVSPRRVPGLWRGDPRSPAETGWWRELGLLCDKTTAFVCYYSSLSIFLRRKGPHHRSRTTLWHVASSKVNSGGSCPCFSSTFMCHGRAPLRLCPSHTYFFPSSEAEFLPSLRSEITVTT